MTHNHSRRWFRRRHLLWPLLCFGLLGCDGQQHYNCDAVGDRVPICGLQAPEDIERTPAGDKLILSQFGGLTGSSPGSLVLFDPDTQQARPLYPADNQAAEASPGWGSDDCLSEPGAAFSPHGIHLSQRADERWQLLAVNHGGREAVEFFEWFPAQETLHWRGCVAMPEEGFINDTVATPGGGFLATQMFPKGNYWALVRSMMGAERGHVWRWRPGQGVDILPGSQGSFPNGIQISDDGRHIFLNLYTQNTVRKLDRVTGEHLAEVTIEHPDNSAWLPDGRLLVASHPQEGLLPDLCNDVHRGACGSRFVLVGLDPDTMTKKVLFDQAGPPMGGGTVAVELGEYWYIGSFAGNRLLRVPRPTAE